MAKLYPSLSLIEKLKVPPTSGELDLIKFLNTTLDDNYEVYYQPYLNGDNPEWYCKACRYEWQTDHPEDGRFSCAECGEIEENCICELLEDD